MASEYISLKIMLVSSIMFVKLVQQNVSIFMQDMSMLFLKSVLLLEKSEKTILYSVYLRGREYRKLGGIK